MCCRGLLSVLLHTRQFVGIPVFIQSFFLLQAFFVFCHICIGGDGEIFNEIRISLDLDLTPSQPLTIPESDALDSL